MTSPKMKDKCNLCGKDLTADNIHILVLMDDTYGKVLDESTVCSECKNHFQFTVGAIEWEDQQ